MNPVYTVGHSNHPDAVFLDLLLSQQIEAIADVRSAPYSRYNPQFDRETLKASLKEAGIQYAWLGKELGARSDDPACYLYGKVQYERLAETELFQSGLARVIEGARSLRVALLCAEKEPLECHRFVLVARQLAAAGVEVRHLHADGSVESHGDALERLLKLHGMGPNLFRSTEQLYEDAYRMQEGRIAYDGAAAADASAA
jgi:uncharacterized protein (DUF488 family)